MLRRNQFPLQLSAHLMPSIPPQLAPKVTAISRSIPACEMQHFCYYTSMNSKQMKKWLEQQGATFQPGKGSHLKVFLNGKQSVLPMHGTTELGRGLEAAIKRQLGLSSEQEQ